MSDNVEENHPIDPATNKKIVGTPADVERFQIGDLVRVHLEMKGQIFLDNYPMLERGVVLAKQYQDDEYIYHMPVVQLATEQRMFNPEHIIVEQREDGSPGEVERLKIADEQIEKARAEAKNKDA